MSLAPAMKTIAVQDAVGMVLCHDITRIVPGESKGPVFRKGHRVREEDIPVLLSVGKENLYVFEPDAGLVHENDAAARIFAAAAGPNVTPTEAKEGRIDFVAAIPGLLRVNVPLLARINAIGDVTLATLHTLQMVEAGRRVAGTRVVPLMVPEETVAAAERAATSPVVEILPLRPARVGMVTTGSEVYHGRIKDNFGPILTRKFEALGCSIMGQTLTNDETEMTRKAILDFVEAGAEFVAVTGGMSVDPDDRTPAAIRDAGARIVTYGAPVYPGAMFMLGFIDAPDRVVPVVGLPGCVMYSRATIFDLVVPRILAGLDVSREDIAAMGHGGFCAGCPECRFPVCPFGK